MAIHDQRTKDPSAVLSNAQLPSIARLKSERIESEGLRREPDLDMKTASSLGSSAHREILTRAVMFSCESVLLVIAATQPRRLMSAWRLRSTATVARLRLQHAKLLVDSGLLVCASRSWEGRVSIAKRIE